MRSKHPEAFHQKWVSYAGTGRNVFGQAMLYGHGRPGPILLLKPEVIDAYCGHASETAKRRLYDVLASGDRQKIQDLVAHIYEVQMIDSHQKTEPEGGANGSQPLHSETNAPSSTAGSRRSP